MLPPSVEVAITDQSEILRLLGRANNERRLSAAKESYNIISNYIYRPNPYKIASGGSEEGAWAHCSMDKLRDAPR
jgi:hypothetical protein